MAYDKQTWDTNSYVTPTRMNHIENGIEGADLTSGGNIAGDLVVNGNTTIARDGRYGVLAIGKGGANEQGILQLFDKNNHYANVSPVDQLGANRELRLPPKDGVLMTSNDGVPLTSMSSDSASATFQCNSQTMYLVVAGVIGGNGSFFLSSSVFLVWRPTNGGTDVATAQLVNNGRTISSATISGENVTLNFSGTVRVSTYRLCTTL